MALEDLFIGAAIWNIQIFIFTLLFYTTQSMCHIMQFKSFLIESIHLPDRKCLILSFFSELVI